MLTTRGDAPHVVRRLPLAFIFRAVGAGNGIHIRVVGAGNGTHIRVVGAGTHISRRWRLIPTFCTKLMSVAWGMRH